MPRTAKNRKICCIPKCKKFCPDTDKSREENSEPVVLTLDEMEAMRLSDLEGLDQDTAARRMEVSRATFQRILYAARKSVTHALINGKTIEIRGGKYVVADCACQGETVCSDCRFSPCRENS